MRGSVYIRACRYYRTSCFQRFIPMIPYPPVIRLVDMGLEQICDRQFLVGVVAQRLMRKVCPVCTEEGKNPRKRSGNSWNVIFLR